MVHLVLGIVIVIGAFGRASGSVTDDFARANQLYGEKSYDSALAIYQSIERTGVESAELNFNIANCHFKSGDIGRAVLYYLRAKRLKPSDDDINANLAFARGYTRIQMEGVQLNPVYSLVEELLDPVALDTLAWLASICFVLFIALLIIRFGFGWTGPLIRPTIIGASLILVLAGLTTTFKYRHDFLVERAVVVAEDCPVLSGPTPQAQTELHGSPGLVVEIIGVSGDYYNVIFENKRRGWILKDRLAIV
jgi:hypothetical protein